MRSFFVIIKGTATAPNFTDDPCLRTAIALWGGKSERYLQFQGERERYKWVLDSLAHHAVEFLFFHIINQTRRRASFVCVQVVSLNHRHSSWQLFVGPRVQP